MLFAHIHSTKEKLYGLFNLYVQLDVTIGDIVFVKIPVVIQIFTMIEPPATTTRTSAATSDLMVFFSLLFL